ncbi:MAG: BrnA antitoxin family protein [Chitinivibrionia bacterium]|nr:BrnA antitoxin family protein [Chitinivibrionia bacterium]
MRSEYDFSAAMSNPYARKLRKSVNIKVDTDTIEYFKNHAANMGMSYGNLINLYLSDCVAGKRNLTREFA